MGLAVGLSQMRLARACGAGRIALPRRVGFVLYEGFDLADLVAVVKMLQAANAIECGAAGRGDFYEICLLSSNGGGISSAFKLVVDTEPLQPAGRGPRLHALFLAGGGGARRALGDERLRAWLRDCRERAQTVVPIAEGQDLMEAAGLCVPSMLGQAGSGAAAALAATLRMIERDLGEAVAQRVGRSGLREVAPRQDVAQLAMASRVSEQVLASARWLEANSDRPISVGDAAQVAAMSERNFLRRFKMELGITPSDYLLRIRVKRSCRLLAETDLPIDKIARRCGIGDGGRMAKIFRKYLANTPSAYRAGLRGGGEAATQAPGPAA